MPRRVVCIVQGRLGSTRLPRKVLADLRGEPLLRRVLDRAARIEGVDEVLLATTLLHEDRRLMELATSWGFRVSAGSVDDVLDRYLRSAREANADVVVRITADCPLLDPAVSSTVVGAFFSDNFEYASNVHPPTYPDGLDTEVFAMTALERAWKDARLPSEREHVTPFLWKQPNVFRQANVKQSIDRSALRWTVDDQKDLEFVRAVYESWNDADGPPNQESVVAVLARMPELVAINDTTPRNEGYAKSLRLDAVRNENHG